MKNVKLQLALCLCSVCLCMGCVQNLSLAQRSKRARSLEQLLNSSVLWMRSEEGNYLDQAESALRLAAELAPRDPRVIDGLGCVYWRRGDFSAAEKYFKQAANLDASYERAYVHLALVAERKGMNEEAGRLLEHALFLNPLDYRARNNYAVHLRDELARGQGTSKRVDREILKTMHSINLRHASAFPVKSRERVKR